MRVRAVLVLLMVSLLAGCAGQKIAPRGIFVLEITGVVTGDGPDAPPSQLHGDPPPASFLVNLSRRTIAFSGDESPPLRLLVLDRVRFDDPLQTIRCCVRDDVAWTSALGSIEWAHRFRSHEDDASIKALDETLRVDGASLREGQTVVHPIAFQAEGRNYAGEIVIKSYGEWPTSSMHPGDDTLASTGSYWNKRD